MISAEYRDVHIAARGAVLGVAFEVGNNSRDIWTPETFSIGCQIFDPQSNHFIEEGAWTPVSCDVAPGASANFEISLPFAPEAASYEVYFSHIQPHTGWAYTRGKPFLRVLLEI